VPLNLGESSQNPHSHSTLASSADPVAPVHAEDVVDAHRWLFSLAAILLGQAIWIGRRQFSAIALLLVVVAIALSAAGLFWKPGPVLCRLASRSLRIMLALGVLAGFCRLPMIDLFFRFPSARGTVAPFVGLAAMALPLIATVFWVRSRFLAAASFALVVTVHFLMGAWFLSVSRDPRIDVYLIQRLGCEALAQHQNPYAMTFPDLYGPNAGFYPAGSVVNGQVQCGYFYPPLSLLTDLPGFAAGDLRYSHLVSLTIAALLLGFARPLRGAGYAQFAPPILLLFTPGVFWMLENAWIEPLLVLMFSATVFFAARRCLNLAAATLGLFFVGKQYAPFAAPAAMLLMPRGWRLRQLVRWVLITMTAGAAVTLPFVIWNHASFFHSLTSIYVGILRFDSTSFLPLIAKATGRRPTLAFTVAATIVPALLVLWRAPRTTSGFAVGAALILLCAFAFSTQSFGNYYFLAAAMLYAAAAVAAVEN
jgi:hypothetical protein